MLSELSSPLTTLSSSQMSLLDIPQTDIILLSPLLPESGPCQQAI